MKGSETSTPASLGSCQGRARGTQFQEFVEDEVEDEDGYEDGDEDGDEENRGNTGECLLLFFYASDHVHCPLISLLFQPFLGWLEYLAGS